MVSDMDMTPVRINTTIPYKMFVECKKNGWKWCDLITSGYGIKISTSDLHLRIVQLEQQIEAYRKYMAKRGVKL